VSQKTVPQVPGPNRFAHCDSLVSVAAATRVDTDGKRIPFDRLLRIAKTEVALLTNPNIS